MAITIAALKTEFTTDPTGLGYAAFLANGSDQSLADTINLPRASIQVGNENVGAFQLIGAINHTDFAALTALLLAKLQVLLLPGFVDATNANTQAIITDLVSAASAGTKTAVAALMTRNGSRAEQLFGNNQVVTIQQAAQSRQ